MRERKHQRSACKKQDEHGDRNGKRLYRGVGIRSQIISRDKCEKQDCKTEQHRVPEIILPIIADAFPEIMQKFDGLSPCEELHDAHPAAKPQSLKADFARLPAALEAALHGEQLQPVLLGQRERAMAFQPGQNVVY